MSIFGFRTTRQKNRIGNAIRVNGYRTFETAKIRCVIARNLLLTKMIPVGESLPINNLNDAEEGSVA